MNRTGFVGGAGVGAAGVSTPTYPGPRWERPLRQSRRSSRILRPHRRFRCTRYLPLVTELASEQATLSALQLVLTARLLASQENAATSEESTDRLLTAEQVATILGVTKRWVERRARRLPFASVFLHTPCVIRHRDSHGGWPIGRCASSEGLEDDSRSIAQRRRKPGVNSSRNSPMVTTCVARRQA